VIVLPLMYAFLSFALQGAVHTKNLQTTATPRCPTSPR
jgi:hypothetical protein